MPTYTDPVFIDGGQDDPQLRVQGHTTQTDPLQTWENSAGVKLAQVDSNGQIFINGSQDVKLLRVQAHSTQNQPLQTWENSVGTALAQVTNDGRLEVGNNTVGGVSAALIEANQGDIVAGSAVKQGIQSNGVVSGAISEPLTWSVHELAFGGSGGVSSNHAGLRSKITQNNTGSSSTAEMRAGEFNVENNQTLGKAVAVRAEISNTSGANLTEAAAFEAVMPSAGTVGTLYGLHIPDLPSGQNRYAIHTGIGPVRFGDAVGIGTVPSTRLHIAQESGLLNPVLENAVSAPEGNTLAFRRARNSLASKALVNNGDSAGRLSFEAWDGSAYRSLARIDAQVAAAPGLNDMPGKLVFSVTPDGSTTLVAAMTINPDGSVNANNVAITGGTINGTTIGGTTPATGKFNALISTQNTIISDGSLGTNRGINARTSGNNRWFVGAGTDDNFYITRYNDDGSFLANAISINRASGMVTIGGINPSLVISGGYNQYKSFTIKHDAGGGNLYNRWSWDVDNTPTENLSLGRFNDAGSFQDYCIVITRSDGNVRIANTLEIDGEINHDGPSIGFYGATPITKPTITGSRGGNAALASLLTALANMGLITNSTTS